MVARFTSVLKLAATAVIGPLLVAVSHYGDPPHRPITSAARHNTTAELLIGTWELTARPTHVLEGARPTYEFTASGSVVAHRWMPGSHHPVPICGRYQLAGDVLRTTVNDGSALTGRVTENRIAFYGENTLVLTREDEDGKLRRSVLRRSPSASSE